LRLSLLVGVGLALAWPLLRIAWQGLSQQETARVFRTARQFFEALQGENPTQVHAFLATGASLPNQPVNLWFNCLQSPFIDCEVTAVRLQQEQATAAFTCRFVDRPAPVLRPGAPLNRLVPPALAQRLDGETGTLHLKRQSGEWRVHAIALAFARAKQAPAFNPFGGRIDFVEKQKFELPAALTPEVRFFKSLAPVDPAKLRAGWQTAVTAEKQPARDVLKALAGELGLAASAQLLMTPVGKALAEPVSIKLQGRSRAESIAEVCRQVNLHPDYLGGVLSFKIGPRPGPVAFAGPFQVTLAAVKEFPASATATVSLKLVALGLPELVTVLTLDDGQALEIVRVRGHGRDLYHSDNQRFFSSRRGSTAVTAKVGRLDMTADIPLHQVFRDLDTIPELRGRVRVLVPTRVATVVFAALQPGSVQAAADQRLTFQGAETPAGAMKSTLVFAYEGARNGQLCWLAVDQKGNALRAGRTMLSDSVRLEVPTSVAGVHFKLVSTQWESWDFELRDLPLQQRAPQKLEPAVFHGHDAPVSIEVERFDKVEQFSDARPPLIRLKLQNHSQKDVDRIDVTFSYRDGSGKELKQRGHTLAEYNALQHRLEVQVASHAHAAASVAAADLPPKTVTIAVTVTRVGFVDGMSWSPSDK
jgi:hypothetical protein